tara:strand:+ start:1485 stop:1793 length:309 start_codon:yes stop_codon:yes gene_type:complete
MSIIRLQNSSIKTIVSVNYSDIRTLIKEVYGIFYEMEDAGFDEYCHIVSMDIEIGELNELQINGMQTLTASKPDYGILHTIMQDLANKDHIDVGEYIIDINY